MPVKKRKEPNSKFIQQYGKIAFHYAEVEQLLRTTMKDTWNIPLDEAMSKTSPSNPPKKLKDVSGEKLQKWFEEVVSGKADVNHAISEFSRIRNYRNDLIHGVLTEGQNGGIDVDQRKARSSTTLHEMGGMIKSIKALYTELLSIKNLIRSSNGLPVVMAVQVSVA